MEILFLDCSTDYYECVQCLLTCHYYIITWVSNTHWSGNTCHPYLSSNLFIYLFLTSVKVWCLIKHSCDAVAWQRQADRHVSVQNGLWGSSSRCLQDHILTDTDTEPQSENNASYTIIGVNDSNTNRLGEGDTEDLQHLVF